VTAGLRQALEAAGQVMDKYALNILVRIAGNAQSKQLVIASWENVLKVLRTGSPQHGTR